ncbi:two-component system sensor histidine kinase NtrB [Sulfurirhabdus autotrophica]|uniref:histidine kinase n=1 Tax=Sulfurirhabdus autotrophica TaxID=1706046 RepID=A0A4R3YIF8_9PROT|nr:ATP-binding protein [Sulfurirhabdus autotrophica]TCV90784.1 two-component system sensor histidine kinase FlrB [Sulfurirhabdus autotrophica]
MAECLEKSLLSDQENKVNQQELEQAFTLFSQASAQLTGVYKELQLQVEGLTGELAVANGELRRQFLEKEALSQRLGLLLEALPGGVVVLNSEGIIAEVNPAAHQMFGETLLGEKWDEVASRFLSQTITPHEWDVMSKEGLRPLRRVSIGSSSLDMAGGRILLIHDVTESHEMQQQLERHQRLSAMGEMAAGLAHQLRTPLATALLYTANLTKPNLPDSDRVRFAEKSLLRLRHLERLIQDMLLFVKGEKISKENVKISALLAELQQVMEPQMIQHKLAFAVEDKTDGVSVLGSRKALTGALLNLLENAMQACSDGGGVVLGGILCKDHVELSVEDTGKGIDAETQSRLFEPFFTTRTEGTGLGLAIVRGVIQAHGGEVQVDSSVGSGSKFIIRLPKS